MIKYHLLLILMQIQIPKIIHTMWLDKNTNNNISYPIKYEKNIATFKEHNPEFHFIFWNIDKVLQLFNHPRIIQYKHMWQNVSHHIQKCDIARYIIIYIYGGLYIDLDFYCYRNLSPLLNRNLLLIKEPLEHSNNFHDPSIPKIFNGFIGSIIEHPFWLDWLDYIHLSLKKTRDVMYTTGPANFRNFFDQSVYMNTELLSPCSIIPIHYFGKIANECVIYNNDNENVTKDYHKNIGNFTDTKWNEGSGWNDGIIEKFDSVSTNNNKYLIVIIVIIIIIIVIMIGK